MSAIAGIWWFDGRPAAADDSNRMIQALRKYPADAIRSWHKGSVFLGCLAQWITPESVHDPFPCADENDRLAITADAILDNREELFDRLQVDYPLRKGMADSALILQAYRKWGKAAPRYLIGDFAFVIWDEEKRRLFAARDQLGNRTLYYHRQKGRFAFCTVTRPLLRLSGVEQKLNEPWLAEFLAIPVIQDTADVHGTVYRGIGLLPPAYSLTVEEGNLSLEQYETFEIPQRKLKLKTNAEYEEAFRAVFQEAVTSKLRTFRQVGASLSGGLDSGAVVGFAADPLRAEGKTLLAYSYVPPPGFTDWTPKRMAADERAYVQATVRHVGNIADHYLDFADRSPYGEIDDLLDLMEAPYKFFENSCWLKGILEHARQDGVGVLLTGARGNYTISWGPALDYYARLVRTGRWVRLHRELKLYGSRMGIGRSRLLPAIGGMAFPLAMPSRFRRPRSDVPQLIHPEFAERTGVMDKLHDHDVGLSGSAFDEFRAREYQFGNLAVSNHQGTSVTKFSLRYGVRERDPTSDPRVIRFCLSLPDGQYVQDGMDRSLIRRAAERYLPDEVRLNQRIRGVQGADWLHRMLPSWSDVTDEVQRLCRDCAAAQYLNVWQIRQSLQEIGPMPKPELAFNPHAAILMRALIVYRFLQRFG